MNVEIIVACEKSVLGIFSLACAILQVCKRFWYPITCFLIRLPPWNSSRSPVRRWPRTIGNLGSIRSTMEA